jgi:hypothetical protein
VRASWILMAIAWPLTVTACSLGGSGPNQLAVVDPLHPGMTGRGSPVGTPYNYTGSSTTPAMPPLPSSTPAGAPNQPSGSQ